MHILIIPSWYKRPDHPFYASFIEEQASLLHKEGVQVGILVPNWSGSFIKNFVKQKNAPVSYNDNGIPTYYINANSIIPRINSINFAYICKLALKEYDKYVKKHGAPDLIHAHSVFLGGIVANYIRKKRGPEYLLTKHSTFHILDVEKYSNRTINWIKETINKSRFTLPVSTWYKNKLKKIYSIEDSKFWVIPNVCNPMFFDPTPIKINEGDKIRLISVGQLTAKKNHKLQLEVVKALTDLGVRVHLTIVGTGELENEIKRMALAYGIQKKVNLTGYVNRSELLGLLKKAHILLSTSYIETFGINIVEAFAMGRPVVATNSGGSSELIDVSNGILIETFQQEDYTKAVLKVIYNYNGYDQMAISKRCEKLYSKNNVTKKMISIYNQIINNEV